MVDARGLRCPLPVLRLAAAVRDLPAGTLATVLATDPAVEHDVPAWAGMRGHDVVEVRETEGLGGPGQDGRPKQRRRRLATSAASRRGRRAG